MTFIIVIFAIRTEIDLYSEFCWFRNKYEMGNKLGLGIILGNRNIPLWVFRIIEKLAGADYAEIKFWIMDQGNHTATEKQKYSFIYRLYQRLDNLVFRTRINYNRTVRFKKVLVDFPSVPVFGMYGESREQIRNSIRDDLKTMPDVILNFAITRDVEAYSGISRYGIWSYKLGNDTGMNGYPGAYWETIESIPEIKISVNIAHPDYGRELEIYRSGLPTYPYSPSINQDKIYALASKILPRLLANLHLYGGMYLDQLIMNANQPSDNQEPEIRKAPDSITAFRNIIKIINRLVFHKVHYVSHFHWFLIFKITKEEVLFPFDLGNFSKVISPGNVDWADPFVVARDNKYYVFLEEFVHKTNKGHISLIEIDDQGNISPLRKILEKPYHLSYPFVFEWEGQFYMIPESNRHKKVDLYSCHEFPDTWEYKMTLINNLYAKDSTLFYFNNTWWLFTAINERPDIPGHDELYIFYSKELFTEEWHPHPRNPVITDIKFARPAGKIFMQNDKIYRLSQDCSGNYGRAINMNRIVTLTETEYAEIHESRIEANWEQDLHGTHTVNFDKNLLVLDAWKYRKRSIFRRLCLSHNYESHCIRFVS